MLNNFIIFSQGLHYVGVIMHVDFFFVAVYISFQITTGTNISGNRGLVQLHAIVSLNENKESSPYKGRLLN
jgi:hypothetical protein